MSRLTTKMIVRGDHVRLTDKYVHRYLGAASARDGVVVQTNYERQHPIQVRRPDVKALRWYPIGVWEPVPAEQDANAVALLTNCETNLTNGAVKLVYADWLEEQGRTAEAAAWSWAGRHGKYPQYLDTPGLRSRYVWWGTKHAYVRRQIHEAPTHALLPKCLFVAACSGHFWKKYPILHGAGSAMEALANGLAVLRQVLDG